MEEVMNKNWKQNIREAYEHVLVMINSVTLLFDYGIGVGNPDWGKKK